jgi:hypothetical protein
MPKSLLVRFTFALVILISLGIIGRNGYQRYLDYRLASVLQESITQEFSKESEALAARKALTASKLVSVRSLLAHGANPNAHVAHGHTVLYRACKHNYPNITALLKQAGATFDQ